MITLRVSEESENMGLDLSQHQSACNAFNIFDSES
jgi:ammonia channel protein AmtB